MNDYLIFEKGPMTQKIDFLIAELKETQEDFGGLIFWKNVVQFYGSQTVKNRDH